MINTKIVGNATSNTSTSNSKVSSTSSPQLFALQARQKGEWKDLIYREALRMTGALRQIITGGSNNRSQLVSIKIFL